MSDLNIPRDPWITEHMDEISTVFGEEKQVHTWNCIALYNSFEDVVKAWGDYAYNEEWCRLVLDKWVFLVG